MRADQSQIWMSWEKRFARFLEKESSKDPAHDLAHIQRVVANARNLAVMEKANLAVVVPAAWLHDCVVVPKNSALRPKVSKLAAEKAGQYLRDISYPKDTIPAIEHAIEAHSFSAGVIPETLEAEIVQDADRLDAVGAIGIARCFLVGGSLGIRLYDPLEPFPHNRPVDDRVNVLDHFYAKLLRLAEGMRTESGKNEALRRTKFMQLYLDQLRLELAIGSEN